MNAVTFNQLITIFDKIFYNSVIWDHSKRTGELCYKVGKQLLSVRDATTIYYAGSFHDIGWIYDIKNEHSSYNHNYTHPDDGYFLFLRFHSDHKIAELIRHHHCYPKEYVVAYNELNRGYPEETCKQLYSLDKLLQILQICNEYDYLNSFTDKDPITNIIYLATLGRWDLDLARRVVNLL